MNKTAGGAVWLNADRMSPYEFWQFWRNTEDDDLARFLRLFTELPLDEVYRLSKLKGADINEAKQILATEVTRLVHGDEAVHMVSETPWRTFGGDQSSTRLPNIDLPRAESGAGSLSRVSSTYQESLPC